MLYRIQPDTTTPTISGRNLAHSKRSVPERAFIGADLHRNRVELVSPTMKQCARLAGVCIPYVTAAIDIIDDPDARDAVLRGDLNILDAAKRSHARGTLVDLIQRSSPEELAAAARVIGVDLIWDSMLQPNL